LARFHQGVIIRSDTPSFTTQGEFHGESTCFAQRPLLIWQHIEAATEDYESLLSSFKISSGVHEGQDGRDHNRWISSWTLDFIGNSFRAGMEGMGRESHHRIGQSYGRLGDRGGGCRINRPR